MLRPAGAATDLAVSAISVSGLRKATAPTRPLRGIDFEIGAGEVFGLLGPNGAGKTTTIEILEGYRDRDARRGRGARRGPAEAGRSPGASGSASCCSPPRSTRSLTVRESLRVFGGYYSSSRATSTR